MKWDDVHTRCNVNCDSVIKCLYIYVYVIYANTLLDIEQVEISRKVKR